MNGYVCKNIFLCLLLLLLWKTHPVGAQQSFDQQKDIRLYIFLLDECVISTNYTQKLNQLHEEFGSEIPFIGVFPNFSSKKNAIEQWVKDYHVSYPVQSDYFKELTRKLGATITPEVVLYDEANEVILYKGRIDNQYVRVGKRRNVVTKHDLRDALHAVLRHSLPIVKETQAIGCYINFNDATSKY